MSRVAQAAIATTSEPISDDFISAREVREAVPWPHWLGRILAPPAMRILALDRVNALHRLLRPHTDARDYVNTLLAELQIRPALPKDDLARIPSSGPVIVVANHPFGAVEGLVLASLLSTVRPDVKLMANYLLGRIGPLRELFFFVDPFDLRSAARRNAAALRQSLAWLKGGGLLAVFPAGEVAHFSMRSGGVEESPWNESIASLIRKSGASVVPVHFAGRNSCLFHLGGLVHGKLRTALLARELVNKQGRTIPVTVGERIAQPAIRESANGRDLMAYLRQRTLLLAHRPRYAPAGGASLVRNTDGFEPVASPVPSVELAAEVAALPARQTLIENGQRVVCEATADQIPHVLRELGRLRELAFRAVGEGTGRAVDLDEFDRRYRHLFIWDRGRQELIGAYRLYFTDELRAGGARSLYTATLFRYAPEFLSRIGPAVELGRSFIRAEHQRSYAFLLLLWKGIHALVTRDGRYKSLFGAVSVSRDYCDASRLLMVEYLNRHHARLELDGLVRPRNPFKPCCKRPANRAIRSLAASINSLDELASVVSDLEPDRKGLPILLKHYLGIGAKVVAFNVDPGFCDALDALTVLDVAEVNDRFLRRLARLR